MRKGRETTERRKIDRGRSEKKRGRTGRRKTQRSGMIGRRGRHE